MTDSAPSFEGVLDAARQIAPAAVRTPLIEHPALNERVGGRVLLKAETLQVAGSFKFRGAYNRISRLTEAERSAGRRGLFVGQPRPGGRGGGRARWEPAP